jgi:hypothetical protein
MSTKRSYGEKERETWNDDDYLKKDNFNQDKPIGMHNVIALGLVIFYWFFNWDDFGNFTTLHS